MQTYQITSTLGNCTAGGYNSLDNAIKAAIQALRMAGHTSMRLDFDSATDQATLSSASGEVLFTAHPRRSVVRSATSEQRPHTVHEEVVKPFRFNGRPSATGWARCEKLCELDLSATLQILPDSATEFLVYMDRTGQPLTAVPLPSVETECRARLSHAAVGEAVSMTDVGCEMALGFLLTDPPAEAVAIFVVARSGLPSRPLKPYGKRTLDSATYKPFKPTSKAPSQSFDRDRDARRAAAERAYNLQNSSDVYVDPTPERSARQSRKK